MTLFLFFVKYFDSLFTGRDLLFNTRLLHNFFVEGRKLFILTFDLILGVINLNFGVKVDMKLMVTGMGSVSQVQVNE